MANYWIEVPIENAKEVVQRFLATSGIPGLQNKTVTYGTNCEVILYNYDFQTIGDPNAMYFGTVYITDHQHETDLNLSVYDSLGNGVDIINAGQTTMIANKYEYIFWNKIKTAPKDLNAYFVGYKFTLV